MASEEKLTRALALRDAALAIVKRLGAWEPAGDIQLLSASVGSLRIAYRTPFQRMPGAGEHLKYRAAQLGLSAPKSLPYALDVWAPKKVLNIEWDDAGNVALVSLRPGAWEAELKSLEQST